MKNTDTANEKGYDAGKKVSGIKRHIVVDSQGLLVLQKKFQALLGDED